MTRKQLLDSEPWIIEMMKSRKTYFNRPLRKYYLGFAADVMRRLRSKDLWVTVTTMTIANITIAKLLSGLGIYKYREVKK